MTEIKYQLDFQSYLSRPEISASTLKAVSRSPRTAKWAAEHPEEGTPSMTLGSAIHCAILEPGAFPKRFMVYDAVRRGAAWEAWKNKHHGVEALYPKDMATVLEIQRAVFEHPVARELVRGGFPEVSIFSFGQGADDPGKKCRVDFLAEDHWLELKTTANGDPSRFPGHVVRMGWHLQIAWYFDLIREAKGRELPCKLLCVEQAAPYHVTVYSIGDAVLDAGREAYRRALARYLDAVRSGRWGGYADDTEVPLALPMWATAATIPPITFEGTPIDF